MINFDIDLDFGDRDEILSLITYTPALIENKDGSKSKHNSGIYVTKIPVDPLTGLSSLEYKKAAELGYFKLDILNNAVYKLVRNPDHLDQLLSKPIPWHRLKDKEFISKLVHIGNYADLILSLPEPIDSIEKLGMFLAIIRPGKKHLQGLPWKEVEKTVWDRDHVEGFVFKKSHSIVYSLMCSLHMKLLEEAK